MMDFSELLQKFGLLGLPFQGNSIDFAGKDVIDRSPFRTDKQDLNTGLIDG